MQKSALAALGALLLLPTTGHAAGTGTALPAVVKHLTVPSAVRAPCGASGSREGVARASYRAPMSGYLTVRLAAARGDWDLAVLRGDRLVGASQGWRAREVVQTWVAGGERLAVQGCRIRGGSRGARVSMSLLDVAPPTPSGTPKLLRVSVGSAKRLAQLDHLGVDVTHNRTRGAADVVVSGPKQVAALEAAGFKHRTLIADLGAHFARSRRADARFAAGTERSPLPSGRETYRDYEDYGAELKELAGEHRDLVKAVTIGRSYQGRELSGVEIAEDVNARDGRPVYFVVALHHAREWPSAEAAMELAHRLVTERRSNPRIERVLERTRTVIVPLINPDGFVATRTAAPADPASNLSDRGINPPIPIFRSLTTAEGVAPPGGILSYRRKNCAGDIPSPATPCELQWGIDPNRNYGQGWGGAGSSPEAFSQAYHGPGPWSEPETQAVHEYSARRQVTMIITIHNVAALVLRPPSRHDSGHAPDELRLREIGDAMAEAAGYKSQFGFQLYDTAGTTEDWNYAAQGAYGYTIEIGPRDGEFHMPYRTGFIDQWTGAYAGNHRGLADALLIAGEAAGNPADHAIIHVKAKRGATLRLSKEFVTKTSAFCRRAAGVAPFNVEPVCIDPPDGMHDAMEIDDGLATTATVPRSGKLEWHVNPSTRPFVGARASIEVDETPFDGRDLEQQKSTLPNLGAPNPAVDSFEDHAFSVPASGTETVLLRVTLAMGEEDDYDLELYRKRGDELEEVESSANGAGEAEEIRVTHPEPGDYVVRVQNWLASGEWTGQVELSGGAFVRTDTGERETWRLECLIGGEVVETRAVLVDRGERVDVKLNRCKD